MSTVLGKAGINTQGKYMLVPIPEDASSALVMLDLVETSMRVLKLSENVSYEHMPVLLAMLYRIGNLFSNELIEGMFSDLFTDFDYSEYKKDHGMPLADEQGKLTYVHEHVPFFNWQKTSRSRYESNLDGYILSIVKKKGKWYWDVYRSNDRHTSGVSSTLGKAKNDAESNAMRMNKEDTDTVQLLYDRAMKSIGH